MRFENTVQVNEILRAINEKEAELRAVNDLLDNISGTATIKINTRWIVQIPAQSLRGYVQPRKAVLENEIRYLKQQLETL